MRILSGLLILICVNCNAIFAQNTLSTLKVTITNVENTKGELLVGLYNSDAKFLNTPFKGITSKVKDTTVVTFLNIPKGIYAISVVHDENENGKLDKNFIGIPKERYGCSNGAMGILGPPRWKDAMFEVSLPQHSITISL